MLWWSVLNVVVCASAGQSSCDQNSGDWFYGAPEGGWPSSDSSWQCYYMLRTTTKLSVPFQASLLYYSYLVCILFGMPSLHPFTFLMFFKSCIKCFRYILLTSMFIDAIPKKSRIRCSEIASEVMFGPKVTASEGTWNNWNHEMTISQEHFFQLLTQKMWCEWLKVLIWPFFTDMQYWISPTPIFYTGLTTECLVKKLRKPFVTTLDTWSLEKVQRVLSYFGHQYLQRNAGPSGGYTCIS